MADLPSTTLTSEITKFQPTNTNDGWFNYPVRVYPHHTDYSGVVWHGMYLTWMEEARVECLRTVGMSFEELVSAGVDLPVAEMSLRYHRSARTGNIKFVQKQIYV
jgi:acyl-CoA thioester hydrolase